MLSKRIAKPLQDSLRRLLWVGLVVSFQAQALCTDGRRPSLDAEFAESDAVAIGVATAPRYVRDTNDPEGYIALLYDVTLQRVFKGDVRGRIVVRSENTSSRCPMTPGEPQLLFLTRDGRWFFVDNCGHSAALSKVERSVLERIATTPSRKAE